MMRSKLFRFARHKQPLVLLSTSAETTAKDKKLEHYKHLQSLQDTDAKPSGWDQAKPFSEIPGPKPLPIIGNVWRFMLPQKIGYYGMDFLDIHRQLWEQYGDIVILRGLPSARDIVTLFNPQDFETLFRNEGVWPIRENLPSLDLYRKSREHMFPNSGLLSQHGEKWFQFRTAVNPVLMQPRNIAQYTEKMDAVAQDLVSNIYYLLEQNPKGEMPSDFTNELYKWTLESIGVVTLDKRLGCLKRNLEKDSEPQKIVDKTLEMFRLVHKLDMTPSPYRYVSTPAWRKLTAGLDFIISTNIKHITEALEKLENEPTDTENETKSVLQQLLKKDRNIAISVAIDMLLAGVDTTGRITGACLYYLSKNPEKQEELRKEAKSLLPTKNTVITKEILAKAKYLKACVKEVTRMAPIGIGNLRRTVKDLVLGGYQIPKGTEVMSSNLVICLDEKYFPRAKEFLPERWLSDAPEELSRKTINPFIFAPFGYGPRSCIGKRLATLEIETATLKIIRNFSLTWPHEDMVFATSLIYGIARPLKLHVKPIDE